jgi:DNA-binding transcriptional ArsR family regulator
MIILWLDIGGSYLYLCEFCRSYGVCLVAMPDNMTTNCSEKEQYASLSLLFASSARAAALRALLLDPHPSYYQRQLESATGMPLRAVQREVDRLTRAGLLFKRVEGNRAYYQVNMEHPLFPELRALVLKTAPPAMRLRGAAALDPAVRLCVLSGARDRALVVCRGGRRPVLESAGIILDVMSSDLFLQALAERGGGAVESYLREGSDLLGRRDDVLWRHIEAAGHDVRKEPGVP